MDAHPPIPAPTATPTAAPQVPIWARPAQLLRRIHPSLAASVRPDLELLARIHPRLPIALPLAVVAIVVVFSVARLTIQQVYTESLIFLVLAAAIGMVAPAAGVLLVLLHGAADLVRALLDPSAGYGQYGPIGAVAGRLISFYLLWLLVVEIPVVGRMVPGVVMDSDRPANPNARRVLAIASAAVAVGLMTWIWTQAAGILIRPVFTWSGLSSPTYDSIATLQVSGMTIVVATAAMAALMGILRLQQAANEARDDPSFEGFEDLGLDEFESEPNEGLGLIGQLGRHLLAIFLLGGLMTGFLDLAILGGVALLSQPIASRVLRNDQLRNVLGAIPWVIRFAVGFGLTYLIGYVINTVRYEPLAGSEFFPLVLTVAFGLLIFQVLLSDTEADTDDDEDDEGEEAEEAPGTEGSPSAGSVIGAALVLFAIGAMLQLAFPGTAFADNCSGLIDCNPAAAAGAAAAGAAAAAAGAAASRNQHKNRKLKKKRKPLQKAPPPQPPSPGPPQPPGTPPPAPPGPPSHEPELSIGEPKEIPNEPEIELSIGEPKEIPNDPRPER